MIENFISSNLKNTVIKRTNEYFSNPDYVQYVKEMSFENKCKILGDLIHYGNFVSLYTNIE